MGIFDFGKDDGDTRGVDASDEEMDERRMGNTIVRKMKKAGLPVDGVKVEFDDGVVTLTGEVPNDHMRETMVVMAGNTPGVARVDDRLGLRGGATPADDLGSRRYTVKKGDTLSAIAEATMGDASEWPKIFEANRPMLEDPDEIYPGQTLRLPPV